VLTSIYNVDVGILDITSPPSGSCGFYSHSRRLITVKCSKHASWKDTGRPNNTRNIWKQTTYVTSSGVCTPDISMKEQKHPIPIIIDCHWYSYQGQISPVCSGNIPFEQMCLLILSRHVGWGMKYQTGQLFNATHDTHTHTHTHAHKHPSSRLHFHFLNLNLNHIAEGL